MVDTAGSAAAPAARCRKFRRGSFILNLPLAFTSLDHLVGAGEPRGGSMPRALAVVRLATRSNLVGCSTGRSAGFVPRSPTAAILIRIRSLGLEVVMLEIRRAQDLAPAFEALKSRAHFMCVPTHWPIRPFGDVAVQQTSNLFDQLVGAGQQRRWQGEAKRSCGLGVDDPNRKGL